MSAGGLRVLVAGAVLGQPMGGVRRHNAELLPRAQALLAAEGGALLVLEGREPPAFALPPSVRRLASEVPAGPPMARARVESRALRAALEGERAAGRPVDLVHTAHLPAPRALPVPFSLLVHDLRALEGPPPWRWLAARVLARACRDAALVAAVGAPVRRALEERFAPRATALVPNGCDHLPLLPRDPAAEPFLLCVGHLEPRKDPATLVRALAEDRALPPLVLVGAEKRGEAARLRALAHELGLAERVRLDGAVDDAALARLYARCACVVLPSRLEGFGIAALEALRAGAPLALSDAAARPLGLDALVPTFPAGDAGACAAAVRRALAGTDTAVPRRTRVVREHGWDRAAEALVAAWRRATGRTTREETT